MKKITDIDEIAAVCSDCGNCLHSCPVYNAELTEPNSPRGKVNLVKGLRDGRLEPGRLNREFLYRCMLCGSCQHTCTKGVVFTEMMMQYRAEAAGGKKIPFLKKAILYFYQSFLLKKMTWVVDIVAKTPLRKKLSVPRRRKGALKTILNKKPSRDVEYDILFFPGCVLTMFYPEVAVKTVRFLESRGYSVVVPKGLECCGFPFLSQGWTEKYKRLRKKNMDVFSGYRFKYLVVPCGTGVMTFKEHYGLDGVGDFKIYELTEFFYEHIRDAVVHKEGIKGPGVPERKVTWHDPCHHLKSLGIADAPRHFMKQMGDDFVDDTSALCCGFGGVFSVGFPSTSRKILNRKETKLNELGVGTVVTACPGCYLQLRESLTPEKDVKFFIDLFE
jgi:glycolate oxidase iron-sulfur subunit